MSGGGRVDPGKLATRRKGIKLCLLVSESNSCRSAYRFMKAFFVPSLDEVHLVTAVSTEGGRPTAIARQRELIEAELMHATQYHVAVKEDDYTLFESLGRYIATTVKPDIIFMGSINLCTIHQAAVPIPRVNPAASPGSNALRRQTSMARGGASAGAATSAGSGASAASSGPPPSILGTSCLALRVIPELRCAPVLLAKFNSRGSWLTSASSIGAANGTGSSSSGAVAGGGGGGAFGRGSPSPSVASVSGAAGTEPSSPASPSGPASLPRSWSLRPPSALQHSTSIGLSNGASSGASNGSAPAAGPAMRVMVDLQANSRHVLDWLFEHFTAGRDHLVLTVSQAYDDQHHIKPAAQRLLTAFGVQAAVNSFEADTAVLEGPPNKSLPAAVLESEPDLLVLQAPRCRGVPSSVVELLYTAKTSFLIWPPDYQAQ